MPPSASSATPLSRRLGLGDATMIGLGSMIGAGIFAAFTPAAAAAGTWLLLGLALAGFLAFCNATSSAQLAAQYPSSGGSYLYGRERLGEWPGFFAGWAFIIGKTASSAAMALTFAHYAVPGLAAKWVAIAAVALLTIVNTLGITRTALLTRILLVFSLSALTLVVTIGLTHQTPWSTVPGTPPTIYGVLQAAAFLFFAFAGYARIATMGEEVRDPARTIPRAIITALTLALIVYVLVAVSALNALGPAGMAGSAAPLSEVAAASGAPWTVAAVRIGAATAALGALLAMIAGIGRTSLAMARNNDLPGWFGVIHPRFKVPYRAEIAVGLVVCLLTAFMDLRGAIAFSSFGVLLYYLVANMSAWTQEAPNRRYPRFLQAAGAIGCVILAFVLPLQAVLGGLLVLAIGAVYRWIWLRTAASR